MTGHRIMMRPNYDLQPAATQIEADNDPRLAEAPRPSDACARSRVDILSRAMLILSALVLVVSVWFPYWKMKLSAPQYPKGLYLVVYPNRVLGDVREIDGLNHYIGMRKIDDAAAMERSSGIPAIVILATLLGIAAIWRSRWAVLLVLPAIVFPPLFLGDLYFWLRDSGLHLDPKAALSSSIKPFVPQVLGSGKIAQFRTEASLGVGYLMSVFSAASSLAFVCVRLRTARRRRVLPLANGSRNARCSVLAMAGVAAIAVVALPVQAETLVVQPAGSFATLADALERAENGDTIVVVGGVHRGPLVVRKSVRLVGREWPVIDGGGRGTVVRLEAPAIALAGFVIRGSGNILEREDGAVLAAAPEQRIEGNRFQDVLFGVYLRQAHRSSLCNNELHGKDLPVPRRGDLIRVWYSDDVTLEANTARGGRDVVLWYSKRLSVRDNRVSGGRYGLHFMYCHDAAITGNLLRDNSVGTFLMYSERLRLQKNWIEANRGASGYGIGLKDMDHSDVSSNVVAGNKAGIFLEHSRGDFENNLLVDNDKGIVIFPSAQGNRFEANTFLNNGEQVATEGFAEMMTTNLWRGNFWSDYRGYDRDGDGRGDVAYRPVRLFERLADRNPGLRLFAENPSAQAIDFATRVFPIFEPKAKFVDESPLMRPLPAPVATEEVVQSWRWALVGAVFLGFPVALFVGKTAQKEGALRDRSNRTVGCGGIDVAKQTRVDASSASSPAAISVTGLTKRFGKVTAVNELSFEIRQSEAVALWGPNGAGKTTVLRCLLGLLPCQGTAYVLGAPCGPRGRASRRLLGYVPQEVRLHADQTVRETVSFYARLRRVTSERVNQLLRDWGLDDVDRRPVRQLSGGMKQKVALVIALLSDPPVLLLDEPTSNLDARARREFCSLLERLKTAGKTLLFCTHRPSEVWRLADRVLVLERGRLVCDGPPETVREHLLEAASLCLIVPLDESADAEARLLDAGFDAHRTGARIWVEAPAGRKLEAIELLNRGGVRILDFDLESDHRSGSGLKPE
jgi:nitrous oxidase accessory protein